MKKTLITLIGITSLMLSSCCTVGSGLANASRKAQLSSENMNYKVDSYRYSDEGGGIKGTALKVASTPAIFVLDTTAIGLNVMALPFVVGCIFTSQELMWGN
jgi:starvation-inducible outer membrane lipoprotein